MCFETTVNIASITSQNRAAFLSKEAIESTLKHSPLIILLSSRARLSLMFLFQFREVRTFHVRSERAAMDLASLCVHECESYRWSLQLAVLCAL